MESLETELGSAIVRAQKNNEALKEFNRRIQNANKIKDVRTRVAAIQRAHKWLNDRRTFIRNHYLADSEDMEADDEISMQLLETELVTNAAVIAKKQKAAYTEYRRRLRNAKKVKNPAARAKAVAGANKYLADRRRAINRGHLALADSAEFATEELSLQQMVDFEFLEEDLIAAAETIAQKQSALYKRYRQLLRDAKKIKKTADRVKKTQQIEAWYAQEKGKIAAGRLIMADADDAADLEASNDEFLL